MPGPRAPARWPLPALSWACPAFALVSEGEHPLQRWFLRSSRPPVPDARCVPGPGHAEAAPSLNRLSQGGVRASVPEGPWEPETAQGKGTGQGERDLLSVMPASCTALPPFSLLSSPPSIAELLHG